MKIPHTILSNLKFQSDYYNLPAAHARHFRPGCEQQGLAATVFGPADVGRDADEPH